MKKSIRFLSLFTAFGLAIVTGLTLLAQTAPSSTANRTQQNGYAENWLTDTQQVLQTAKKENKAILINFTGSDWCPPCIMLKQQVLDTPEFKAFADKQLILQVADFPRRIEQPEALKEHNMQLAQKYGIVGFPTLIILNSDGKQIGQMGFTPGGPEAFISQLEKIIAQ